MKKRSEKIEIVTVTNTQDMLSRPETLTLLSDIRSLIEAAHTRVSTTANMEMVLLYWHIGNRILKDILGMERADYGKQIVQTLSGKLTREYGRGFTRTNIFNMIRCAEVFPEREIVHALSGQLSWTHFREIIYLEEKPQSAQRTQRKRQCSVFSECSVVLDSLSRMILKCSFFPLTDNIRRTL
jgi:hypothetical protein